MDDGCRYMEQSSIEERNKNFDKLVNLLKKFGWWDKAEIIDGDYLDNFNTVKNYINKKIGE